MKKAHQNFRPPDSIPPNYLPNSASAHRTRVLVIISIVAAVLIYWSMGRAVMPAKLICISLISGIILYFAYSLSKRSRFERECLARARKGEYLSCWVLNEEETHAYRKRRSQKKRFWFVVLVGLPWLLGIVLATLATVWNIVDGVNFAHSLNIGVTISLTVTVPAAITVLLCWVWTIPSRAERKTPYVTILFLNRTIHFERQVVAPHLWTHSRKIALVKKNNRSWLKITLKHWRHRTQGSYIDKKELEFPIPNGHEQEIERLTAAYGMTNSE